MAAFIYFTYSISIHLYHAGCVFFKSGASITETFNYFKEIRDCMLITRYLDNIDAIYEQEHLCQNINLSRNKCVICRTNKSVKMRDVVTGTVDLLQVERAEEAIENGVRQRTALLESQTQLQEDGLICSYTIGNEISAGISFYVTGTLLKNCERFAVNLTYGHLHKDIALHVNPRLPQNYIVRTSKINGSFGKEETTSSMPFTLERGKPFTIQILVTEEEYYISVNGLHFALYKHRVPYQRVTCIQVLGNVCDVEIKQLPMQVYPEKLPESSTEDINCVNSLDHIDRVEGSYLQMPYYGHLKESLVNGGRLHILGRVKLLPHSFYVNLQSADRIWPHPTIPFHLNPRFASVGGKHKIIQNAWLDSCWGNEERSEIHTNFMPSRSFHMIIEAGDESYNVFVNKQLLAQFKYRTKPDIVDTVYIQGDIKLQCITQEISPTTTLEDVEY